MALVAGSQYDVFTADQVVNFGFVFDQGPNVDPASLSVPPPVPGAYNLEVEIVDRQPFLRIGLNVIDGPAPGYQGTALLLLHQPADLFGGLLVNKFAALHGDYGVVDTGGNGWISAGDGNVSILGASGDTLYGGAGNSFLDAHLGNQLVNAGNGTIWGGAGDTIYGLFGNVTIGGGAGDTIYGTSLVSSTRASATNRSWAVTPATPRSGAAPATRSWAAPAT